MLQLIKAQIGEIHEEVREYRRCMDHGLDELEHAVQELLPMASLLAGAMPSARFAKSAQTRRSRSSSASQDHDGPAEHLPSKDGSHASSIVRSEQCSLKRLFE